MTDPMLLIFPRPELDAGNLAPLLRRFAPEKLPLRPGQRELTTDLK